MNYQAQRLSSQSPIVLWLFPNPSGWYRLGFRHQDATSDRGHGSLGNLEEALVRAFQIDDQDGHTVEQPDRAPVKNPLLQHPYRQASIHAQAPAGKPKAAPAPLRQSETHGVSAGTPRVPDHPSPRTAWAGRLVGVHGLVDDVSASSSDSGSGSTENSITKSNMGGSFSQICPSTAWANPASYTLVM
jgi:hypothetical protein